MVIRRKAGGFTLAEILITLVIIGFVGALGIPMLGQTKLKKPVEIKAAHGTIECFWRSGHLYQWEADNRNNKNGILKEVNDACYFSAPTANFFVVQAVGAGGTGANGLTGKKPWYKNATVEISGSIPVNDNFLFSITDSKVPDWVRKEWNKQWLDSSKYVEYELESPLGASGNGACLPMRIDSYENKYNDCSMECVTDIANCPEYCIERFSADGGDSGRGARYKVRTKIYFSPDGEQDSVTWTANTDLTSVRVGSKSVVLRPSGDGEDGRIEATYQFPPLTIDGKDGQDFREVNFENIGMEVVSKQLLNNAQKGAKGCEGSNFEASAGSIKSTTGAIPYYTESLAIEAYFGLAGEPGQSVMKVLEKLPEGTMFKLIPASSNEESSELYVQDDKGNWILFMKAQSGADSNMRVETIPVEDIRDLPFPRKYYPDAFSGKTPELIIATGAGYTSYIQLAHVFPGDAGSGAHPLVTNVEGTAVHSINNVITGNEKLDSLTIQDIETLRCYNTSKPGDGWASIPADERSCGGQFPGNPGAVVIAW